MWGVRMSEGVALRTRVGALLLVCLVLPAATMFGLGATACSETCARRPDHRLDRFKTDADTAPLIGLSRSEVFARLGPPTSPSLQTGGDMNYWLRPQGFCMDGWYLALYLEDDVVVRARVIGG